jgi:type I restriction enzyme S subunit
MMEELGFRPYGAYKDSYASWLGEVPADWQVGPGRICVYENKDKNTGMKESTVLSLSYGRVIVKDEDKMTGLVPESYETYQIVQPGDIIIRGTDLQNDVTSLRTGLAKDHGIITSAYINLRPKPNAYAEFLHYLLHSYDVKKVFYGLGSGLRQNLSYVDFKYLTIPLPSLPEQRAIVAFLDDKCAKIDGAVKIKEDQIALLRERRQIIIQDAVTRGLNPAAPMKDSGIDWIGQIPAHWEVKRNKHMFVEINQRSAKGTEQHLSMSQKLGLVPANLVEKALVSESYEGAKLVQPGDLVLNRLKAHLAVFSIAQMEGLVSPDYSVFHPFVKGASSQYYEALFKTSMFLGEFRLRVRGIVEGFYRLYTDSFMDIPLLIPPQAEQDDIVAHLDQLAIKFDAAVSIKQDQIAALKEYKTSLINAAVTGKIKVI